MPHFFPTSPMLMSCPSTQLDLHVHAGGEVELHQRIHGLVVRIDDVQHALVGAGFVLVAGILVHVRRHQDGVALDLGRQRNRAAHLCTRALGRFHDLAGRLVDQAMVIGLQPDADVLGCHVRLLTKRTLSAFAVCFSRLSFPVLWRPASGRMNTGSYHGTLRRDNRYSITLVTTPAPTVRPPSRIANLKPSCIAIGWINVTTIFTLSPGITISTPAGNSTAPVMSVVRK